jgi:hypothetical protein
MALAAMRGMGLDDSCTVVDVGAGWTELEVCLRREGYWMGRYIPVDACIDGVDLEDWLPPRSAEFFVALEVIEHMRRPLRLLYAMAMGATKGVVVTTPNPRTTDVLGMGVTHQTPVCRETLESLGFEVQPCSLFGKPEDSLFATWGGTKAENDACGDGMCWRKPLKQVADTLVAERDEARAEVQRLHKGIRAATDGLNSGAVDECEVERTLLRLAACRRGDA